MHEELPVQGNADVQFLAAPAHEQRSPAEARRGPPAFRFQSVRARCAARGFRLRRPRKTPNRCNRSHQAQRRQSDTADRSWKGAIDHDPARVRSALEAGRRGRFQAGRALCGCVAQAASISDMRPASHAAPINFARPTPVVANAAPTMPASERKVPTHSRASQCSLSMNFSGSSVMPPHRTMRSGHSSE